MNDSWVQRVRQNLLPLSLEKQDLTLALKEWYYAGTAYDLEVDTEDCELCDHPNIRFQFEIYNQFTEQVLMVGSECITKFDIAAQDDAGRILGKKASKRKVAQDRRKLIDDARKQRMLNVLLKLARVDQEFKIDSFITYVQDRGAFTPDQLKLLIWRLEKHRIQHQKSDFKLIVRRDREKQQLLAMEDWQLKKIWDYMSDSQRDSYNRKFLRP